MPEPPFAGLTSFPRPPTPYESYMEEEGIPIHHGRQGYPDVRALKLGDWDRLQARGAFIELSGVGNLQGTYLLEVAAGSRTSAERHLFEEIYFVLEGSGSTRVWVDGSDGDIVEWRPNSVFTIPLNAWHEHTAAPGTQALLLAGTNAPPIMQLFQSREYIFGDDFHFADRYLPGTGFFSPTGLKEHPMNARALNDDGFILDVTTVDVPVDGQRGAGHRHFELEMAGNHYKGFVAEYPEGRYSKAHAHESGPILVCLAGAGYTLSWPKSAGTRPWEAGNGADVVRTDYGPGGIVSAAPGGADWFHAHFGASKEPFRVMALSGGHPKRVTGRPGDIVSENQDMLEGGDTIGYAQEDPAIREIFRESLSRVGATFDMPDELYGSHADEPHAARPLAELLNRVG